MIQNIALGLQVLIGALTTALGAALSGKNVRSINPLPRMIHLRSMLDVCCDLDPRWRVDAHRVVPRAHEGYKRATNVYSPCPTTRAFST